jgi:Dolichyl-phosphate-mannose-protein mannosyltransferase
MWMSSRLTPRTRRLLTDSAARIIRQRSPGGTSDISKRPFPARIRLKMIPAWLWLLIILAAAAFLRLHGLDQLGFNSDEAVYAGQAASIAGSKAFLKYFPIYRAHPVLYQATVSIAYHFVLSDFVARFVAVLFGLATIVVCYHLGSLLYGRRVGLLAAGLLALMPYHVVVSRQALLDGPEVFFATLALYALARYRISEDARWLIALGGTLGLAFLTKETVIVMLGAVFVYFALDADVRVKRRAIIVSVAIFLGLALVYPVATAFGGASKSGKSFFLWQLLRKPNHGYGFYFSTALPDVGILVIALAAWALIALRGKRSWRETMLLSWIGVPFLFFDVWPTKGYQYLLLIAPPIAVLAAHGLAHLPRLALGPVRVPRAGVTALVFTVVVISLLLPSWSSINAGAESSALAGSGGLPAGRETGRWIAAHLPEDTQMLAIGPSMANVLEWYGDRKVWGLSVSTDPRQRNPVYQPVKNPDLAFRDGTIQYIVWDAFSAGRSKSSSDRLLRYVRKYRGRLIYQATIPGHRHPVIRIYEEQP